MSPMNKVMVTLSQTEWNRAIVLQRVVEDQIVIRKAPVALGLSGCEGPEDTEDAEDAANRCSCSLQEDSIDQREH